VAIFGAGFLNQPSPDGYPIRPDAGLEACHYQQAADAAEAATVAKENLRATASKAVALDAASKVDAANRAKADAQYCEQKLHDASDLWAQWQAATAATNSARYAAAAYWWLVFDLSLLSLTLAAAFWAAREARRAATAAEGSLQDAKDRVPLEESRHAEQLAATREIGHDQLRAYISVSGYRANLSGLSAFSVDLINRGQTPARGIKVYYELTIPAHPDFGLAGEIIGPPDDFLLSTFDLGKDQPHTVSLLVDARPVLRQRLERPVVAEQRTHFVIYVSYRDVFGRFFEFKSECEFTRMGDRGHYETANLTSTEIPLSAAEYGEYISYKGAKK
jgi:hypothetical protein